MTTTTDATTITAYSREELRVELLLHLPEIAFGHYPANEPEFQSVRRDVDYDAEKLADWILERVDAARAELTDDETLGEVASMATANGMLDAFSGVIHYLENVARVLQRNMTITEQTDLSRTIRVEAKRLRDAAGRIIETYPALAVAGPDPEAAGGGLVIPIAAQRKAKNS